MKLTEPFHNQKEEVFVTAFGFEQIATSCLKER
jgi:hypothetical protein